MPSYINAPMRLAKIRANYQHKLLKYKLNLNFDNSLASLVIVIARLEANNNPVNLKFLPIVIVTVQQRCRDNWSML